MGAVTDHDDSTSGTGSESAGAEDTGARTAGGETTGAESPAAEGPAAGQAGAEDPRPVSGASADEPRVVPQLTVKQSQRVGAPARAMIISMAVMLLLVLPFFLLQPRPDGQTYRPEVDVAREAAYAAEAAAFDPVAPDLGADWSPNYARWQGASPDGVSTWEAGWVTPQGRFLGLVQTDAANPTWTLSRIDGLPQTGTVEAGGITWAVHTGSGEDDEPMTAWTGELDDSTVILQGTAPSEEFDHAAEAVVASADEAADAPTDTGS